MLVTASKDTTMKMFQLNIEEKNRYYNLKFDRAFYDIGCMIQINEDHVVTYSTDSKYLIFF